MRATRDEPGAAARSGGPRGRKVGPGGRAGAAATGWGAAAGTERREEHTPGAVREASGRRAGAAATAVAGASAATSAGGTGLRGRPRARTAGAAGGSEAAAAAGAGGSTGAAGVATGALEERRVQAAQCHSSSGMRRNPAHFKWATAGQVEQQRSVRPTRRLPQRPQSTRWSERWRGRLARSLFGRDGDMVGATKSNTSERASKGAAEPKFSVPERESRVIRSALGFGKTTSTV